jgi:hypothetical protein
MTAAAGRSREKKERVLCMSKKCVHTDKDRYILRSARCDDDDGGGGEDGGDELSPFPHPRFRLRGFVAGSIGGRYLRPYLDMV